MGGGGARRCDCINPAVLHSRKHKKTSGYIKAAITRSLKWGGDVLTEILPYRGHQTCHIQVPKTGRRAMAEKRGEISPYIAAVLFL